MAVTARRQSILAASHMARARAHGREEGVTHRHASHIATTGMTTLIVIETRTRTGSIDTSTAAGVAAAISIATLVMMMMAVAVAVVMAVMARIDTIDTGSTVVRTGTRRRRRSDTIAVPARRKTTTAPTIAAPRNVAAPKKEATMTKTSTATTTTAAAARTMNTVMMIASGATTSIGERARMATADPRSTTRTATSDIIPSPVVDAMARKMIALALVEEVGVMMVTNTAASIEGWCKRERHTHAQLLHTALQA